MQINKISAISASSNAHTTKNQKTASQNVFQNNKINLNNNPASFLAKSQISFKGTISEDLYSYLSKNLPQEQNPNYAIQDSKAEFVKLKAQYVLLPMAMRDMEDAQSYADYAFATFGKAGRTPNKLKLYNAVNNAKKSLCPKDRDEAQSEIVTINNQDYAAKLNDSPDGQMLNVVSQTDGIEYSFISPNKQGGSSDGIFYLKSLTTPEYNSPNYKIYFDDNQQISRVAVDYKKDHDCFGNADKIYTINRVYSSDNYTKTLPLETMFSMDTNCRFVYEDSSMVLIGSDARYTTRKSSSNSGLKFGQISSFFNKKLADEKGYVPIYSYTPQKGWKSETDYKKFNYFQ